MLCLGDAYHACTHARTHRQVVIGVAGIPGSGKTTLSQTVSQKIGPQATFVPIDGFHLTRAALSAMPDPEEAHARRGAAFTFDAGKYLNLVRELRAPISSHTVWAPSFDHAVKDPKERDIAVRPEHKIVVMEGNYVALDQDVWRDAAKLFDELWFVEVDFQVARKRLAERHLRAGIVNTIEEGDKRAVKNDLVNGEEIVKHLLKVDETIVSREVRAWAHG